MALSVNPNPVGHEGIDPRKECITYAGNTCINQELAEQIAGDVVRGSEHLTGNPRYISIDTNPSRKEFNGVHGDAFVVFYASCEDDEHHQVYCGLRERPWSDGLHIECKGPMILEEDYAEVKEAHEGSGFRIGEWKEANLGLGAVLLIGAVVSAIAILSACADIEYDTPFDPDGGDAVGGDGEGGDGHVEGDGTQAEADQVGVDQAAETGEEVPEFGNPLATVTDFDVDDGCTNPSSSISIMYLERNGEKISVEELSSGSVGETVRAYLKRGTGEPFECNLTASKDPGSEIFRWGLSCATTLGYEEADLWVTPNNILKIWGEWDYGDCSTTGRERL